MKKNTLILLAALAAAVAAALWWRSRPRMVSVATTTKPAAEETSAPRSTVSDLVDSLAALFHSRQTNGGTAPGPGSSPALTTTQGPAADTSFQDLLDVAGVRRKGQATKPVFTEG